VKRFSWILTVPLIFVAVVFLISNRDPVTLDLLTFELQLSLLWVLLACVVFGLVVGSIATWLSAAAARQRARQARRRVVELEREASAAASADRGQPGLPSPVAGAPEPEKRRALGRY
jgi:uncharacterized integral membrane protein